MCFICVGLADLHRSAHVHQRPHGSGVPHTGPSAFSVPHLPSGGRHHRGETHKQARVCSQTLQTAARPRGHVAGPATELPGQEPPFHCAYDADAISPSLDMQTRPRRKAQCVARRSSKPWHGTDATLFSRTAPLRKWGCFSLTPPPLQRKEEHLFLFSEHDRTKMPTCHKCCASGLSGCPGREGWGQREGQPVPFLMVPLTFCLSPCRVPQDQTGLARPK